jgi:hypothetical protein
MKTALTLALPADHFASGLETLARILADYAAFNG